MQTHDGLFGRITQESCLHFLTFSRKCKLMMAYSEESQKRVCIFLENARRCEKGGRYTCQTPCANSKNIAQRYKDTTAFKDKENTWAFKAKASTRLPSQTRRLVTRRFGIDERRFELLKGALRKDALRQITEPQRRHCQMFCTANAFNRAVDGLRNQASGV